MNWIDSFQQRKKDRKETERDKNRYTNDMQLFLRMFNNRASQTDEHYICVSFETPNSSKCVST